MKRYRLRVFMLIVLLCITTGLVFAAVGTLEAAPAIEPQPAVYGEVGGVKLVLDVYEPAPSNTLRAAVVLIHGGAGSFGDRSIEADRAHGLAANGYVERI